MSFTYGSHKLYDSSATYGGYGQFLAQNEVTAEFGRRLRQPGVKPVFLVTVDVFEPVRSVGLTGAFTLVVHPMVIQQKPYGVIHGHSGELVEVAGPLSPGEWIYVSGTSGFPGLRDQTDNYTTFRPVNDRDPSVGNYRIQHKLGFASVAKTFRSKPWQARIISVPNISSRVEADFSGVSQIGGGRIVLNNGDGYFDNLSNLIWDAGTAKMEIGFDLDGSAMDEADYQTVGTWDVVGTKLTDETFTLDLREKKTALTQKIPKEIYTREDYPQIALDDIGKPIPRAYGKLFGVSPTVIDRASRKFKVAHHAIRSFDGVKIKQGFDNVLFEDIASTAWDIYSGSAYVSNESREVKNITFDGTDLTEVNSKESVVSTASSWFQEGSLLYVRLGASQTFAGGTTQATINEHITAWQTANFDSVDLHLGEFILGSDWDRDAEVSVDFSGRTNPDGTLMVNGADIMADFLDWLGVTEMDIASFGAARAFFHIGYVGAQERVTLAPCIYINEKVDAIEVVSRINETLGSMLFVDAEGRYRFRAFAPQQGYLFDFSETVLPRTFTEDDVLEGTFEREVDSRRMFSRIKVDFAAREAEDWRQSITASLAETDVFHGLTDEFEEQREVCLSSKGDAQYYAQRVLTTEALPQVTYRFELPWKGLFLQPGDQFRLQDDRFLNLAGIVELDNILLEVLEVDKDFSNGRVKVVAGDRRGWGDTFGHWLPEIDAIVPGVPNDAWSWSDKFSVDNPTDKHVNAVRNDYINTYYLTAANTGQLLRPVVRNDTLNGHPSILFNAAGERLRFPKLDSFSEGEIFAVLKIGNDPGLDEAGNTLWHLGTGADPTVYPDSGGLIQEGFGSTTRHTITPSVDLTSWRIYNVISTPTEFTVNIDSTQEYTTGTNTVGFLPAQTASLAGGMLAAGKTAGDETTKYALGLYVAQILFFSRKLTSTERTAVVQYLSDRYALGIVSAGGPPPSWDKTWSDAQAHEAFQNAGFWQVQSNAVGYGGKTHAFAHTQDPRAWGTGRWF